MRWFYGTLAAIALLLTLYFGSAYAALSDLVNAARHADGPRLLQRTDALRLKRSIAGQILRTYLDRIGETRRPTAAEQVIANAVAATLADALAVRILTADGLSQLLNEGRVESVTQLPTLSDLPRLTDLDLRNLLSLGERLHLITPVEMSIRLGDLQRRDDTGAVRLHLDGSGWKLSGIELPPRKLRDLAARLPVRRP
jgi:hypothetical protein